MLVLTRKKEEQIRIGDDITITVCKIKGDKVSLGIEAPREVTVHRKEVYDKNQQNKEDEAKDAAS